MNYDEDVLGPPGDTVTDPGEIQLAMAGWEGEEVVEDLGKGKGEYILCRVTLYAGRDAGSENIKPWVAKGKRALAILCAMDVPPIGTQVLVMRPANSSDWYVVGTPKRNSTKQFTGSSRTVLDFGNDRDVIIRARSVTLMSADKRFLAVGPETGITVSDVDGSGFKLLDGKWAIYVASGGDAKSLLSLSADKVSVWQKNPTTGKCVTTEWGAATMKSVGSAAFVARFSQGALGTSGPVPAPKPILGGLPLAEVPSVGWFIDG